MFSVDDNSSGDESLQVVGVTPAPHIVDAALEGKPQQVIDPALEGQVNHVRKRAGELAFAGDAQVMVLYKRCVPGNDVVTSICRDFPEKLTQDVVTMAKAMMTPPEKKR